MRQEFREALLRRRLGTVQCYAIRRPNGGRQSPTKWPALARSAARTASAERNLSTLVEPVPS